MKRQSKTTELKRDIASQWQETEIREVRVNYKHTTYRTISQPEEIADFVREHLSDNSREHLFALFLDVRTQVIGFSLISIGSSTASLCSVKDIYQRAILMGAHALIMAHNHPSQNLSPSPADLEATRSLKQAGQILGVQLLDHVIVGDTDFYSLGQHGHC